MDNQQSAVIEPMQRPFIDDICQPIRDLAFSMLDELFAGYRGKVKVFLWDGTDITPDSEGTAVLIVRDPAVIREYFMHGDLVRLAEAYLSGYVDADGDMIAIYDMVNYLLQHRFTWREKLGYGLKVLRLPRNPVVDTARSIKAGSLSRTNSHTSIAYHYDVSNEFYRLWLDRNMVYSCAYFKDGNHCLDQAQEDKIDHICRKLRLASGQAVLDVGCGWGALAIWAAQNYDVQIKGITLSKQQHAHANERIERLGLKRRVSVQLMDYHDLPEDILYDRVVSVGMFEHVGIKRLPQYFTKIRRVLKPDGVFLNHGITNDNDWPNTPITQFCNYYVFPDGELTCISSVQQAMEDAGFEVLDVESLRQHYAMTLQHWMHNLERNYKEVVRQTSEMTYRTWRLYMAGAAHCFAQGDLGLYQILAGHRYQSASVPLTRTDIYS